MSLAEELRAQFEKKGSAVHATYDDFLAWVGKAALNDYRTQAPANLQQSPAENQVKLETSGLRNFAALIQAAVNKAMGPSNGNAPNYTQFPDGSIRDGMRVIEAIQDQIENSPNNKKDELRNELKLGLTMGFNVFRQREDARLRMSSPAPRPEAPTFRPTPFSTRPG